MIGSIVGGIAQYDSAKKAAQAQAQALAEQRARLDGISIPEAKQLVLRDLVSAGNLTPELAEAFDMPPSEVAAMQEDQGARNNQVQALELIKQRAQSGLSMADRADLNTIRNQVQRDSEAKQQQILQQMQARGMGGSGSELAAQLAASQQSAQTASDEGMKVAAQASNNALAAAAQMASQSGTLRNQDWNVQNTKATAQDEYNRFNTTNRQAVANNNTQSRNQAQQFNLTNAQNISNQNTQNYNEEQGRFQDALQRQFQNQWMKATGQNAISAAEGNNNARSALAKGQMIAGIGQAADETAYKVGGAMMGMSDERVKKDVKSFDADAFLSKLSGKKYKYKDEKHGKGEQTGVMAQDLEKTPEGAALVEETSEGKAVDYGKASGLMMASLAELNQRLKALESKKG